MKDVTDADKSAMYSRLEVEFIEVELDPSSSSQSNSHEAAAEIISAGIKKLEKAIHEIVVCRSEPNGQGWSDSTYDTDYFTLWWRVMRGFLQTLELWVHTSATTTMQLRSARTTKTSESKLGLSLPDNSMVVCSVADWTPTDLAKVWKLRPSDFTII
ncbi:Uncharacterized protein Fot_56611 [Forsythia ovata]|uniref:Uncharacterized protein n=1 Tax=Forsythia ovata TaxID=205694 RepID=A0ABD1NZ53_9LAMI